MQVSDRFHLIKGFSEALDKYLRRELPLKIEIPMETEMPEEYAILLNKNNRVQRIIYGRNSFEVLKAKVLLHELNRCKNT